MVLLTPQKCRTEGIQPQEEWRPIPRYQGLYEASSLGRVRSVARLVPHKTFGQKRVPERVRAPVARPNKYLQVPLYRENKVAYEYVHRLVYEAFHGAIPPNFDINHKDFNRQRNEPENLEALSRADNIAHAKAAGKYAKSVRTSASF